MANKEISKNKRRSMLFCKLFLRLSAKEDNRTDSIKIYKTVKKLRVLFGRAFLCVLRYLFEILIEQIFSFIVLTSYTIPSFFNINPKLRRYQESERNTQMHVRTLPNINPGIFTDFLKLNLRAYSTKCEDPVKTARVILFTITILSFIIIVSCTSKGKRMIRKVKIYSFYGHIKRTEFKSRKILIIKYNYLYFIF